MTNSNPLAKHFRQPSIYLKLPSQGKYWPEDAIELGVNGDIPVYPMTTKDEIILRTPDALMNGEGVVKTIESCCPNIKNAWAIPNGDIDAILIAIRIASYGSDMNVDSKCPHCTGDNTHSLDLNILLDRLKFPDFSRPVMCEDLQIKLKPQSYAVSNKANMAVFEEQKMLNNLFVDEVDEQTKQNEFNLRMKNLNDLNNDLLVAGTEYIETADKIKVTDASFIREFFENAKSNIIKKIKTSLEEITKQSELPPIKVNCDTCEKQYDLRVEFDYARFFDND